ncbi:MAG: phosphomethylpyrimidine synthase [Synergistales bacterium]|nr:phosphomethylpyrimidine synthase [Synergistales bacterium]
MKGTILEQAKAGVITREMKLVAEAEGLSPESLRDLVAQGKVVIPKNAGRDFPGVKAVGKGLSTKVNANLGTSDECADLEFERRKLEAAIKAGTDTIMDLSTGGDLDEARAFFLENSPVAVGTVPIYGLATEMVRKGEPLEDMTEERLFASIEAQCRRGVDYITVHCGVNRESAEALEASSRIMPCVSRGGSIHLHWMRKNGRENPLYEHFDDLLDIARRYDVTLSLGDGFRPGAIADAIDGSQITELLTLARLAVRAREKGVQVMIEGPGHVPLEHIQSHVQLEKRLTGEAPFYVLGPLPTDIAAGYDHIAGAIGGALAGAAGADFLCYVTPAEHLCLPDENDVYQGVMASRIAAHVADLVKGVAGASKKDEGMSMARSRLDWEAMVAEALDPELVRMRAQIAEDKQACTMCGKLCAVKLSRTPKP